MNSKDTQKALIRAAVNLLSDFYFEFQSAAYETESLFSLDLSWRPAKTFFHATEIWQLEDILFLEEYQYKWAYIQSWKVSDSILIRTKVIIYKSHGGVSLVE